MPHNHLNENWHPFDIDNEMWLRRFHALPPSHTLYRSRSRSLSQCECGMGNSWWMRQEHLAQVQINYWTHKNQPATPFPCLSPFTHLPCSPSSHPQVDWAGSSSQNASTFTLCCPHLPSLRQSCQVSLCPFLGLPLLARCLPGWQVEQLRHISTCNLTF